MHSCPTCGSRSTARPNPELRPNEHTCLECAGTFTGHGPARVQAFAQWNGRTPTSTEMAEYWTDARRERRVRDLAQAIGDAIEARPELAELVSPRILPDGRQGVVLDDDGRRQIRDALAEQAQ